jgi:hypothetical protein
LDSTDKEKSQEIEEIEKAPPVVSADLNSKNCAVLIATKLGGLPE